MSGPGVLPVSENHQRGEQEKQQVRPTNQKTNQGRSKQVTQQTHHSSSEATDSVIYGPCYKSTVGVFQTPAHGLDEMAGAAKVQLS